MSLYRSYAPVLEERFARFRRRREGEKESDAAISRVFARRCGRIAGGIAGIVSGLAMVATSCSTALGPLKGDGRNGWGTCVLLAGTPLAFAVWAVARRIALETARAALRGAPRPTDDAANDVARIDAADPLGDLARRTTALERKSIALPLVATVLLAPHTLHLLVVCAIAAVAEPWRYFDIWIALSSCLAGLAYVVCIVLVVHWACSLRLRETARLGQGLFAAWGRIVLIISATAAFPAVLVVPGTSLGFLPPLFVAVTAVAFLPLAFMAAVSRLREERAWLEASDSLRPERRQKSSIAGASTVASS
jgi:MFS family permease